MRQLRTPKEVTGIDFGIPSLTITGLVRGEIRPSRMEEHQRDPSGRMAGLSRLVSRRARPSGGKQHRGHVDRAGRRPPARSLCDEGPERARDSAKDRSRDRHRRQWIVASPARPRRRSARANAGPIPPTRSTSGGSRASASACSAPAPTGFDNAAVALEAGAARVDMCLRRAELPRVNPLIWTNFSGMLGHFAELDDLHRWRFMRYILEKPPMPPPQETFWRCRKFDNFAWHTNCRMARGPLRRQGRDRRDRRWSLHVRLHHLCHRLRDRSLGAARACADRPPHRAVARPVHAAAG